MIRQDSEGLQDLKNISVDRKPHEKGLCVLFSPIPLLPQTQEVL